MKVLLVNGSPHKNGCTHTALKEVASTLEFQGIQTEIFWLGNQPISGCIGCGACKKTGRCFIENCANIFSEKAATADGFIFGSPVHYAAASGALTSFMDRAFYGGKSPVGGKPAAAVVSCRRGVTPQPLTKSTSISPSATCLWCAPNTGTKSMVIPRKKSVRMPRGYRPCGPLAITWLGF
ncbi:MAG: flavodoxin family protein [Chitinophagaceae bacterium]